MRKDPGEPFIDNLAEVWVRFSFWVQMVITILIGVIALFQASGDGGTAATIAFLIFLAAVVYGFVLLRREFDRFDRLRH